MKGILKWNWKLFLLRVHGDEENNNHQPSVTPPSGFALRHQPFHPPSPLHHQCPCQHEEKTNKPTMIRVSLQEPRRAHRENSWAASWASPSVTTLGLVHCLHPRATSPSPAPCFCFRLPGLWAGVFPWSGGTLIQFWLFLFTWALFLRFRFFCWSPEMMFLQASLLIKPQFPHQSHGSNNHCYWVLKNIVCVEVLCEWFIFSPVLFKNNFIFYLFIYFGCFGPSLLLGLFSSYGAQVATL